MKKAATGGAEKRGAPAQDVDAYLAAVPEPARSMLKKMRQVIQGAAPKAVEVISYGIPLYKHHGHLVGFAAWKSHCAFYVVSTRLLAAYEDEIQRYKKAKTTLHFPIGDPLPAALVTKIVKARVKENEAGRKG